ncbi:hypothetical protein AXF42_Ash003873 [Apostasia shenzhenica]|uniref:Uncharacterized protein n=1 Tax=Apostasia shenzhenica TaxID=1088818 RepID=A0A2I0AIE0_9ASPA|nr:hypothetical protein AXF42_Ash003873 [Apostasia shenzhenica]
MNRRLLSPSVTHCVAPIPHSPPCSLRQTLDRSHPSPSYMARGKKRAPPPFSSSSSEPEEEKWSRSSASSKQKGKAPLEEEGPFKGPFSFSSSPSFSSSDSSDSEDRLKTLAVVATGSPLSGQRRRKKAVVRKLVVSPHQSVALPIRRLPEEIAATQEHQLPKTEKLKPLLPVESHPAVLPPISQYCRRDRLQPRKGSQAFKPVSTQHIEKPPLVIISDAEASPPSPVPIPRTRASTKGKEKADDSFASLFRDAEAKKFLRLVISAHVLNVGPLNKDEMDSFINKIIDHHGWGKWVSYKLPSYPSILKHFYANLKVDIEGRLLETIVLGTPVTITEDDLISFFGFTTHADPISVTDLGVKPSSFIDIEVILGFEEEYNPPGANKHVPRHVEKLASCSDRAKTLGRILQECLIQVRGHKDEWTDIQQTAVYHLLQRRSLDTVGIILSEMEKCHNAAQRSVSMRSLHYGNVICEYLTARLGFDFSAEAVGVSYYQFSMHNLKLRQPKPSFSTHTFGESSLPPTSTQPSSSAPPPSTSQPPSTSGVESLFTTKSANFVVDSFRDLGEKAERNH